MSFNRMFVPAAALAAAVGVPAGIAWAGSVDLVSQARTLSAQVRQESEATPGEFTVDEDSALATGFGMFEAEVDARVENESGQDSFASGRVSSDVRDDGFDAEGEGRTFNISSNDSFSTVDDGFNVVFDVTGNVRFNGSFAAATEGGPGTSAASLRRVGDGGATLEDFEFTETEVNGDDLGLSPNTTLRTLDEVLGDGRYEFATSVSLPGEDAFRTYGFILDVELTSATDEDGGGSTPIPLPPAALAGLSVMGGAGLIGSIRKRLRARRA